MSSSIALDQPSCCSDGAFDAPLAVPLVVGPADTSDDDWLWELIGNLAPSASAEQSAPPPQQHLQMSHPPQPQELLISAAAVADDPGHVVILPVLSDLLSSSSVRQRTRSRIRCAGEALASVRRAAWWQALVPNGLIRRISMERDITCRFAPDMPHDVSDHLEHCAREVRFIAKSRRFYLGITEDPPRRWAMHCSSGAGFAAMRILAVAPNSRTTAELERALIAMFHRSPLCANVGVGGEAASSGSPHFLYLVFREDGLTRRGPSGSGSGGGRGHRMGTVMDDLGQWR